MNVALDRLSDLVYKIEPSLMSGKETTIDDSSSSIFNRKDLLRCAAEVLQRLNKENEERKLIIKDLTANNHINPLLLGTASLPPSETPSSQTPPLPHSFPVERALMLRDLQFRRSAIEGQMARLQHQEQQRELMRLGMKFPGL